MVWRSWRSFGRGRQAGVALAAAGLFFAVPASAADVNPASVGLRPTLKMTNYIRVVPEVPFSSAFVEMIRRDIGRADGVNAAGARWQAEVQGIGEKEADRLPSGTLYGEGGYASTSGAHFPYAYGVRLSLPVYDGGARSLAVEAQTSIAGAARAGAVDELASSVVDLVSAAGAIRQADQTIDIRRSQLAAMQDLLAEIVAEKVAGTASGVDTSQVESEILRLEVSLDLVRTSRAVAEQNYSSIAGAAPGYIGAIGSLRSRLPSSLAAALAEAEAANPKLQQKLDLASAGWLAHKSTQMSFGPDLSFDVSAGGTGDVGTGRSAMEARAVFRLEVPLSFGAEPAVSRKAYEAQAAEFESQAARSGIRAATKAAFERLAALRQARSAAYDALDRSQSVLTGMKVEHDLGERSVFDLISAQNAAAEARIQIVDLEYQVVVAEHLLAADTGRLLRIYGLKLES